MKICPRCNTQLDDSAKFCPRCGTALKSDNTVNEENAVSTGAAVNNTESQPQQPPQQPIQPQQLSQPQIQSQQSQPMQQPQQTARPVQTPQPQQPPQQPIQPQQLSQPQTQSQQSQPMQQPQQTAQQVQTPQPQPQPQQTPQQYQQPVQPVQQQYRQQPVQPQYQPPKQQYQQPQSQYNQTTAGYSAQTNAGSQGVLSALKSVCASPVILIAIIAFSLAIVLNIAQAFLGTSNIFGSMYASLYTSLSRIGLGDAAFELMRSMQDIMDLFTQIGVVLTVVGQIPSILIMIGSWIAFASAANKHGPMKTGGLTLVKVIVIINFVFVCSIFLFLLIAIGVFGIAASGEYEEMAVFFIAAAIVLLLVLVFAVFYYVFLLKTINAIKDTAKTGTPYYKASVFIAVCLFISSVSAIMSVPQALISGYIPLMVSGFAALCTVVSSITYGIFIFIYRSRMKKLYDSANRNTGAPGYYYQPQGGGQGYYQPQQGNGQNYYQPPRQ